MAQAKIEFRKVRDFGQLLSATFEFIRQNFKLLFKSNLLIAAPFILLAGVFMGLYQSSLFDFSSQPDIESFGIPFLISIVFLMFSYLIITMVTYSYIILYKNSEFGSFDIDDVWKKTKSNFWMLLFTGIGFAVVVFFGFLLLIIPGIYLSVALSIIYIVRMEEGVSLFDAINRCIKIISANWWFTFGVIIVVGFIQGFIGFIFYIPSYIVMFLLAFAGVDAYSGGTAKILFIISSIISSLGTLLYAINTIAIAFQYYNLIERKEAPGLMQQIENIK
ncbi:MAG: hypothetical protein KJN64_02480 [Ignavibacteria bacterium]|nr:hypothetical protein [Ignavibacteria bacterium]MBT8384068.1 hypothetical protein [Ignavibacteria bacterium]MBT8391708.1 hypothetical protein [Ignavibacteria bacterium]NNJ54250.1 hypothetical protein [Ignavibacteriaceae bacterium]NNL22781.1 hypothetical protein [Ignavibacteriaceae bacterium]